MQLKEFVLSTIRSIIDAIEEAKVTTPGSGSVICPPLGNAVQEKLGINLDAQGRYHQSIEFDIAITAASENSIAASGKGETNFVMVACSGNLDANHKVNSATVSRVKFSVPIGIQCSKTN